MRKLVAGTLVAGMLGFGGVAYAASGPTAPSPDPGTGPAASAPAQGPEGGAARRACRHHPRRCAHRLVKVRHAVVRTAAEAIGISREDLATALRAGSSIADVAREHGVDPAKVTDALVKEATDRIEAAVEAGRLDEERAARIEARLPEAMKKLVERKGHPGRGDHEGHRGRAPELRGRHQDGNADTDPSS